MSQSHKLVGTCPSCASEQIYKGTAKRPRITCKKCKTRFYIEIINAPKSDQKDSKESKKERDIITKKFESLDEKTIEKLILDLLNDQPTENRIKLAVDFHNKIRGTDAINMEEGLNMEGFLHHELSEREKESSQSIHETA